MKQKKNLFIFTNFRWYHFTEIIDSATIIATDQDGGDHELAIKDIELIQVNGKDIKPFSTDTKNDR